MLSKVKTYSLIILIIITAVFWIQNRTLHNKLTEAQSREKQVKAALHTRDSVYTHKLALMRAKYDSLSINTKTITEFDSFTGRPIKTIEWKKKTQIRKEKVKIKVHDTITVTKKDSIYIHKEKDKIKFNNFKLKTGLSYPDKNMYVEGIYSTKPPFGLYVQGRYNTDKKYKVGAGIYWSF